MQNQKKWSREGHNRDRNLLIELQKSKETIFLVSLHWHRYVFSCLPIFSFFSLPMKKKLNLFYFKWKFRIWLVWKKNKTTPTKPFFVLLYFLQKFSFFQISKTPLTWILKRRGLHLFKTWTLAPHFSLFVLPKMPSAI